MTTHHAGERIDESTSVVQLAMGSPLFEESKKGLDSSPNFSPARSTLARYGGARAEAERFPDLSKGVAGAGPLISKQHTVQALVRTQLSPSAWSAVTVWSSCATGLCSYHMP